jgi:hypothetical protein
MKAKLDSMILCTGLCITAGTTFGQAGSGALPAKNDTQTLNSREARQSIQFFHSRDLVGANVKDLQGEKLGDIYDILFSPQSGDTFVAIGVGKGGYALVPAQALNVAAGIGAGSPKADVTLNATKEELQTGPLISNDDWERLDTPSFVLSIYSHYKLHMPSAMGGERASGLGGVSSGTVTSTNNLNAPTTVQPK